MQQVERSAICLIRTKTWIACSIQQRTPFMSATHHLRRQDFLAIVLVAVCAPLAVCADPPKRVQTITSADWPMYNHDLAGWRFNPAEKTLSPANVEKLVEKWRFPAADSKESIGVVH